MNARWRIMDLFILIRFTGPPSPAKSLESSVDTRSSCSLGKQRYEREKFGFVH